MPIKPQVPLMIALLGRAAPTTPRDSPSETDYRVGALSPANWGEDELEKYMQIYIAQEAPRTLGATGAAALQISEPQVNSETAGGCNE